MAKVDNTATVHHTPGPWSLTYKDGSGLPSSDYQREGFCIVGSNDESVCHGGNSFGLPIGALKEADARLIAAAPDLLQALKLATQRINDGMAGQWKRTFELGGDTEIIKALEAAIAKAEGRT